MPSALLSITTLLILLENVASYKILVAPLVCGFNSRLMNMQKMADMLAQDGHQVDVLINNRVEKHSIVKHSRVMIFHVSDQLEDISHYAMSDLQVEGIEFFKLMSKTMVMQVPFCDSLFQNEALVKELRDADYDLILADIVSLCSGVLASYLNTPTILYQNFGFWPDSSLFYPLFSSISCHSLGAVCLSDDMTFFERVLNTLFLAANNYYVNPLQISHQNGIAERAGLDLKVPLETVQTNAIVLINDDYVLETPRPTMPHVFLTSGLFHKMPSPLNSDFQKIEDQSGYHGVIIMSFGTLVPKFEPETAEKFAKVFGKLKQQVIWRYTGEKPRGLKNNTHLTEWFPQNDLLANPATKLFITHCGISSTFESTYNGVPVIAMPLFGDQQINAFKLINRVKIGVQLEYFSFTEEELEKGINEVLSNPFYRDNAKRASLTMSDQVAPPVHQFRHLVNFTIRTEGAKHLFHPYAVRMSWFTYFSVDVLLFLFSILISVIAVFLLVLRAICARYNFRISMSKKSKEQ